MADKMYFCLECQMAWQPVGEHEVPWGLVFHDECWKKIETRKAVLALDEVVNGAS